MRSSASSGCLLHVCLGQRESGEPDGRATREIEGWILGWEC
jgi:hypothetical protein